MGPSMDELSLLPAIVLAALEPGDFAEPCSEPDDADPPPWPAAMAGNYFRLASACEQIKFSDAWEKPRRPKQRGPG